MQASTYDREVVFAVPISPVVDRWAHGVYARRSRSLLQRWCKHAGQPSAAASEWSGAGAGCQWLVVRPALTVRTRS